MGILYLLYLRKTVEAVSQALRIYRPNSHFTIFSDLAFGLQVDYYIISINPYYIRFSSVSMSES